MLTAYTLRKPYHDADQPRTLVASPAQARSDGAGPALGLPGNLRQTVAPYSSTSAPATGSWPSAKAAATSPTPSRDRLAFQVCQARFQRCDAGFKRFNTLLRHAAATAALAALLLTCSKNRLDLRRVAQRMGITVLALAAWRGRVWPGRARSGAPAGAGSARCRRNHAGGCCGSAVR